MQSATIWLTENCNLKCKYCYEGQEKRKKRFNTLNISALVSFIEREILDITESGDKVVISFHGGEPIMELQLMKKIVFYLDKAAEKRNISVVYEITTNGNVNEREFLEYVKNKECFRVSVSLDGRKESNDLLRLTKSGESSFNKAFRFAKSLLENNQNPRIRMTLTPEVVEDLYENVVFFIREGFAMIVTVPDYFNKGWNQSHLVKLDQQLRKIKDYCDQIQTTKSKISLLDQNFCLKKIGKCHGGINEVQISCDGLLYPCTYTINNKKYCMGDIWEGINEKKQKDLILLYEQKNKECMGCGLESTCICTRCKYLNEAVEGKGNKPVPIICGFMNTLYIFFKDVNTNSNLRSGGI